MSDTPTPIVRGDWRDVASTEALQKHLEAIRKGGTECQFRERTDLGPWEFLVVDNAVCYIGRELANLFADAIEDGDLTDCPDD